MCVPKRNLIFVDLRENTFRSAHSILSSFDHGNNALFLASQFQVIKYKAKLHRILHITELHMTESAGNSES